MIAVCRRSTRNAFSGVLKALSLCTTNRQGTLITYIRGKGIIDPLAVKGYVWFVAHTLSNNLRVDALSNSYCNCKIQDGVQDGRRGYASTLKITVTEYFRTSQTDFKKIFTGRLPLNQFPESSKNIHLTWMCCYTTLRNMIVSNCHCNAAKLILLYCFFRNKERIGWIPYTLSNNFQVDNLYNEVL